MCRSGLTMQSFQLPFCSLVSARNMFEGDPRFTRAQLEGRVLHVRATQMNQDRRARGCYFYNAGSGGRRQKGRTKDREIWTALSVCFEIALLVCIGSVAGRRMEPCTLSAESLNRKSAIKRYSGRDCVKSLQSSYTGLYPQRNLLRARREVAPTRARV